MTSASELFHSRRSRFGRSSLIELGGVEGGLDSSSHFNHNRISNINNHRRQRQSNHYPTNTSRRDHHRLDIDGCDHPLPRRPPHLRHRPFLPDRESGVSDQSSSHSASATVNNSENPVAIQDRLRFVGNDRLPGTVLLARERLFRRLRGLSLSESRPSNRVSPRTHQNDIAVEDDFRFVDTNEWENEIPRELAGEPLTDIFALEKSKRPPGLSLEAVKSLQVVIFSKSEKCEEEKMPRASEECSICLEIFVEGDKLICLPCRHRFHRQCLDPWVRICGDCPYCRMDIILTRCTCRAKVRL